MAGTVAEIMDPDFFYASQSDSIGQLLHDMAALGLASAPVLDLQGHPLGMATARDIDGCRRVEELSEQLQQPVISVHQNTPIDVAARTLAEHDSDCLVLLDDRGVAVGALRALDLLRAVLGLRVSRPAGDGTRHTTSWSRCELLDLDGVRHAPAAPGVLLLEPGPPGSKPNIVWVEATSNLRERLDEMLRLPQDEPTLERLLSVHPRTLMYRVLVVSDPERRARLLRALQAVLTRRVAEGSAQQSAEE